MAHKSKLGRNYSEKEQRLTSSIHEPSASETCLLIIDMVNAFTFPDAEQLLPAAVCAATNIAKLKERAVRAAVPTIYVNDNFGQWRHDLRSLVDHCLEPSCRGQAIVKLLRPHKEDYFVLKPKHSGFFATPLELLLKYLRARHLVITGVAGNSCVLYTAADAYMRDFSVSVPEDCTASFDDPSNQRALEHMHSTLKADIRSSARLGFP